MPCNPRGKVGIIEERQKEDKGEGAFHGDLAHGRHLAFGLSHSFSNSIGSG